MKFNVLKSAVIGLVFFASGYAKAGLIESVDINLNGNDYSTYSDTISNFSWLDLDNWFQTGASFNSVTAELNGTGYQIATLEQINAMVLSAAFDGTQTNFDLLSTIMGGITSPRGYIWGVYDDLSINSGYAYMSVGATTMTSLAGAQSKAFNVDSYNSGIYDDLGFFVVSTQPRDQIDVPEPSTLAIFALGIMGLAARRFKKQS